MGEDGNYKCGDNNGTNKTKEKQRQKVKRKVAPSNRRSGHGNIGCQPVL